MPVEVKKQKTEKGSGGTEVKKKKKGKRQRMASKKVNNAVNGSPPKKQKAAESKNPAKKQDTAGNKKKNKKKNKLDSKPIKMPVEVKKQKTEKGSGGTEEKKNKRKRKASKQVDNAVNGSPPKKQKTAGNAKSGSPAKKQDTAGNKKKTISEKMVLKGKLFDIYCERKKALDSRSLFVVLEEFKHGYYSNPPSIFKNAQHVRMVGTKGLVSLEYKSVNDAEKMKAFFENSSLVKEVRFATRPEGQSKEYTSIDVNPYKLFVVNVSHQVTKDMLEKKFPTAKSFVMRPKSGFAHVIYETKEEAAKVFEKANQVKCGNVKLTVLYVTSPEPVKPKKKKKAPGEKTVKKSKPGKRVGPPKALAKKNVRSRKKKSKPVA
ncbi:muscle M-line assembly protein unc-89-like [Penaeus japonicus]|uniref:muscle M-line assembly protein unc-89-like n=1 Tax=Penaeus japonicus TaxID=27405 RepID=UPI001C711814|nr:muscle M-line assembly protein unc-89-like [Penaeus japonicus]